MEKIGVKENLKQIGSGFLGIGKGIGNGVKNTVAGAATKIKEKESQRKIDRYTEILLEMDPDW